MEHRPSLVVCVIAASDHSSALMRARGPCVIDPPTMNLPVVCVGTTNGAKVDTLRSCGLAPEPSLVVEAPAIAECHAQFACRLHDDARVERYDFLVFQVVRARLPSAPEYPRTVHRSDEGRFLVAGEILDRSALVRPEMLEAQASGGALCSGGGESDRGTGGAPGVLAAFETMEGCFIGGVGCGWLDS